MTCLMMCAKSTRAGIGKEAIHWKHIPSTPIAVWREKVFSVARTEAGVTAARTSSM